MSALNAKNIKAPSNKGPKVQQDEIAIGNYMARVAQIVDLGVRPRDKWDPSSNSYIIDTEKAPCQQMKVTYEFVTEFCKKEDGTPDEDKPRWLSEDLNLFSLDIDLATSTKRYKAIDPLLEKDGDWVQLVGMPCMVTVVHKKNGKAKIGSVTPAIKGIPVPELKNEPKVFLIDDPDMEVFGSLPEWIQDKVKTAINFKGSKLDKALNGEQPVEPKVEDKMPEIDEDIPW